MSAYSFPFREGDPVVPFTLGPPDPTLMTTVTQRETFAVDTGFSDYVQVDWETFCALGLQRYVIGTLRSELADGSVVVDVVASVWVLIPECRIKKTVRCISNPAYGKDLLLVGSRLLKECHAVIDYREERTTLSD
jgi:predicted aspartyl protease